MTAFDKLPYNAIKEIFMHLSEPFDNRKDTRFVRSPPYGVLANDDLRTRNHDSKMNVIDPKKSILHASLACRRWYSVGIETMYTDLFINKPEWIPVLLSRLQKQLYRCNATNSLTAGHFVRRIDLVEIDFPADFHDTMSAVLAACVNLEVFCYDTATKYSQVVLREFLRGTAESCPKLKRLNMTIRLTKITDPSVPPYTFLLSPFHSLTVLELHEPTIIHRHSIDSHATEEFRHLSFPHLRSLILYHVGRYIFNAMARWDIACICHLKVQGDCFPETINEMRDSFMLFLLTHGAKLLSLEILNRNHEARDMAMVFQRCPNLKDLHTDIRNIGFAGLGHEVNHNTITCISLSFITFGGDGGWDEIGIDAYNYTVSFIRALEDATVFPSLTHIFVRQEPDRWNRWFLLTAEQQAERHVWARVLASRGIRICDEGEFMSGSVILNHKSIHLSPDNFCLQTDALYI